MIFRILERIWQLDFFKVSYKFLLVRFIQGLVRF